MDSEKIGLRFLSAAALLILLLETISAVAATWGTISPLVLLGGTRLIQIAALLFLSKILSQGLVAIGLSRHTLSGGFKTGLLWSATFSGIAAIGFLLLFMSDKNPLLLIRTPLPRDNISLFLFFAVGGIIAPIAEELFFRGILYTYLRRWGIFAAVVISTLVFVLFHAPVAIPATQIIGGIVFALSYEYGKSLATPVTIHILGNLSIFFLSLTPT